MKIFLTICVALAFAGATLAQDIISLRDNNRIENVQVTNISNTEITFIQNDSNKSIPHNSVEAILYSDGRYEAIPITVTGDSATIANVSELGYDAQEWQNLVQNGEDRKLLLWQDYYYPKECRKKGKKAFFQVFNSTYTSTIKRLKKEGLSKTEAVQQAMNIVFSAAMKASNEVVRECNGGM